MPPPPLRLPNKSRSLPTILLAMTHKTFHVISLPHTQVTHEFDHCAYTAKVRKFCDMMHSLGHKVYLYASEENEANCTELVTVITKTEQQVFFGDNDHTKNFFNLTWGPNDSHWVHMNNNAIREINKRIGKKDFICIIGGECQKQIANAFPNHQVVEFGIGYKGVFSNFKVFESNAWRHMVYGDKNIEHGNFYDTVIPNYYDINEFPFSIARHDYFLFVGRLIHHKGYHIAQEACERVGARLILAGQGEFSGYGEHIGVIDAKKRGELMSRAKAVFVPTTYVEPFGGVHAEALLCGTPVITTDFGVFTETVKHGVNGWRCNTFQDFLDGMKWAEGIDAMSRLSIQEDAQSRFGMQAVGKQYEAYFSRLLDLWEDGWYTAKD